MDFKAIVVVEPRRPHARGIASHAAAALEHVANQPIAYHVLDALEAVGVREVIVTTPASLAGDLRTCLEAREKRGGARLRYVSGGGSGDLSTGIRLAAPLVGEAPCIVHPANGLLDQPLDGLMGHLGELPDVVFAIQQTPAQEPHLSPSTSKLMNIAGLDPQRAAVAITGVSLFGPHALSLVGAGSPVRADPDLTLACDQVRRAGGRIEVCLVEAWCRYTGDSHDLLELNRIVLEGLKPEPRRPDSHGNRVEGRVSIHADAKVRSSVIVGPAMIGPGARIENAYIGPYTSVGANARIEGAEVERSIISDGARITHVGGRLVSSVVGKDARIFRDFSLPRALRMRVGEGTEVALC